MQQQQPLEATVTYNGGAEDRSTALDQDELEKLRKVRNDFFFFFFVYMVIALAKVIKLINKV